MVYTICHSWIFLKSFYLVFYSVKNSTLLYYDLSFENKTFSIWLHTFTVPMICFATRPWFILHLSNGNLPHVWTEMFLTVGGCKGLRHSETGLWGLSFCPNGDDDRTYLLGLYQVLNGMVHTKALSQFLEYRKHSMGIRNSAMNMIISISVFLFWAFKSTVSSVSIY